MGEWFKSNKVRLTKEKCEESGELTFTFTFTNKVVGSKPLNFHFRISINIKINNQKSKTQTSSEIQDKNNFVEVLEKKT